MAITETNSFIVLAKSNKSQTSRFTPEPLRNLDFKNDESSFFAKEPVAQFSLGNKHRYEVNRFVNLFVKAHQQLKRIADDCAKSGKPAGGFSVGSMLFIFGERKIQKSLVPESFPELNCSESITIAIDYWLDRGQTERANRLARILERFQYAEKVLSAAMEEWSEGHPEEPPTADVLLVLVDEMVSAGIVQRPYGASDRRLTELS